MRHSAQVGRIVAALAAILAVGLSAGCGSSTERSTASSAAAPAAAGGSGGSGGPGMNGNVAPVPGAPAPSGQTSLAKAPVAGRSLVYTATMTVRTKDVAGATANAESLAAANGGFVGDEKSVSGTVPDVQGVTQSTVTLRVPSAVFDKVIGQLGSGGVVQDQTRSATDVTSQVVDTSSRITAQQASISRLTDLMKSAANMSDVVTLEGELSRREADLESMQAQLATLNDQVSLSTITVTFLVPEAPAPKPAAAKHRNALQRGLHDGWQAFTGTLKVLLVIVGTLLPFAVLVAVLWWPVKRLVRLVTRVRARLSGGRAG
ncbi:hypothetical protein ABH926_000785 [Catenulispora sp. GP43]|uniref:DUF4349 domain-containing protein n=1 Tax=Catenulispora sp. GP43 TaxID=3156263 RepID=UPI003512FEBB